MVTWIESGSTKPKIGFIGLGIMGRPMAKNLIKAGYDLTVYNRTTAKTEEFRGLGARVGDTPADVAKGSDVVITMVSDTPDVEEVILGSQGVIHGARPGSVVIDMSTISPSATREIAQKLAERGVEMLDAPVSGGEKGAIEGTLSIMVGGKKEVFDRCVPVFEAMGKNIVHMGPNGAGQTTKLCNQVLCSLTILSMAECLVLGAKAGLDLEKLLQAVSGGAGGSWSLSNLGPKVIRGDFSPGFMVKLHQKDIRLVLNLANQLGVSLPGTALANQLFNAVEGQGEGNLGNQAMIKPLEKIAGCEARK
ncbi:MAG TPA: 2-hydroxy-3-oxopropionate reductase [Clostridia bacterium]|nr:2-hydroxy-3-oxopropionate reductase [Clostridia bacterium]